MGSGRTEGEGVGWWRTAGGKVRSGGTGFGCPREHRDGSVAPQVYPPTLDVGCLARSLTQVQSWKLSELNPKAQSPWDQKEPLAHTQRGSRPGDPLPGPPPSQEGGNTDRSHSLRPNPKLRAEGEGGREGQPEQAADTATPHRRRRKMHRPHSCPRSPAPGCCPAPPPQRPQVSRPSSTAPRKAGTGWGLGRPPSEDFLPTARAGRPQPPCGSSLCLLQGAPASTSSGRGRTKAQKGAGWRAMMPWEGKLGEPAGDPTPNPTHWRGPGQQEDTVILPKKRLNSARRCWRH